MGLKEREKEEGEGGKMMETSQMSLWSNIKAQQQISLIHNSMDIDQLAQDLSKSKN